MERRRLLTATGALLAGGLAGCLGTEDGPASPDGDDSQPGDSPNEADEPGTDSVDPDEDACSPASRPLSARLVDEPGGRCHASARPTFVVANERETAADVTVEVESETSSSATYALDPGERSSAERPVELGEPLAGTITVDGERRAIEWPERSCLRHAVAITTDGIETGWIEPTEGPGDTQHDCYAGDAAGVWVSNAGDPRTITVTAADRCDGTTSSETLTVADGGSTKTEPLLVQGRDYELTVEGDGVEADTVAYHGHCWQPYVEIAADGTVSVQQVPVM